MTKNINDIFKDNLNYYLKKQNKTQKDLADYLNVSTALINYYVKGRNTPRMDKVDKICDFLNITRTDLITARDKKDEIQTNIDLIHIPLYEDIACGDLCFLDDDIIDTVTLPSTILKKNKEYFCNYAKGDSMIDRGINDSDLLFFEKCNTLENGQIGSFCYENEATCKVYAPTPNGVILMPANAKYKPIVVTDDSFRIVGKLVYKLSKEF